MTCDNNVVKIDFSRAGSFLGMKRSIQFDASSIVKFSVSNKPFKSDGFRIFGIFIPYLLKMGMFYSPFEGNWEYWNVNYMGSGYYCEFNLKNNPYKRILIKTDDTQFIERMKSLQH